MFVIEVLLIVALFLWLLTLLPQPASMQFNWAAPWLAWISVVLLTVAYVAIR